MMKKLLIYEITKKLHVPRQTWSACDFMKNLEDISVCFFSLPPRSHFLYSLSLFLYAYVSLTWIYSKENARKCWTSSTWFRSIEAKSACAAGYNFVGKLSTTFSRISSFHSLSPTPSRSHHFKLMDFDELTFHSINYVLKRHWTLHLRYSQSVGTEIF